MAHVYVGTSGWNYREWRGSFFPEDLVSKKWLTYYATRFDSVEINYTFYRLPSVESCRAWYRETPANFRFAVKASRYITHIKRLRDSRDAWDSFLERVQVLKEKLGPILLQFPSNFRATETNLHSVDEFLKHAARPSTRLALEFRDGSCLEKEMVAILRRHRAALVVSQSSMYPMAEISATSDFAYFRFHGPKKMFSSGYSSAKLRDWADQMKVQLRSHCDVYAYFNNDSGGYAPRDAQTLLKNLQARPAAPAPHRRPNDRKALARHQSKNL
jgi:uncharacterized protein YecE (DUF72 family)